MSSYNRGIFVHPVRWILRSSGFGIRFILCLLRKRWSLSYRAEPDRNFIALRKFNYCSRPTGEMGWTCGAYGRGEGVYRFLVGKPEGKRPLGRTRRRWVDNIRMDLQEVGCGYMDWIGLVQDRDRWRTLVSALMNLRVPWNAGNFLTSCKPVIFSRRTLHHGVSK